MIITATEKYTLFKANSSFENFSKEFSNIYNDHTTKNVVLDFSSIEISEENIQSLENYAESQAENNKSFAIVASNFDADAFEEELNVVPTLIEAEDIIDMDEMTRDLDF